MRRAAALLALGLALTASACTSAPESPTTSTTSTSASTSRTSTSSASAPTRPSPEMVRAVRRVAAAHPDADIAMGWAPVGRSGRAVVTGDSVPLVAWSTIKVPLALAVVQAGDGQTMSAHIGRAITASDNDAARRLWEGLGTGPQAAQAVEEQLQRGRDRRTGVPSRVTVPGYSPFGQATWRLGDQTRFTATLPCLAGSRPVTTQMGQVVEGQRWGLGRIDGARFKGGWGSTPQGYVVRQLGIVPGAKGDTAVTLQVRTGTHEQGTAIADELAAAVRSARDELPVGRC